MVCQYSARHRWPSWLLTLKSLVKIPQIAPNLMSNRPWKVLHAPWLLFFVGKVPCSSECKLFSVFQGGLLSSVWLCNKPAVFSRLCPEWQQILQRWWSKTRWRERHSECKAAIDRVCTCLQAGSSLPQQKWQALHGPKLADVSEVKGSLCLATFQIEWLSVKKNHFS